MNIIQEPSAAVGTQLLAALQMVADETRCYESGPRPYSGDSYLPEQIKQAVRAAITAAAKQIADEIAVERIEREQRLQAQIAKAQAADPPGGRNITPTEILPIVAKVA